MVGIRFSVFSVTWLCLFVNNALIAVDGIVVVVVVMALFICLFTYLSACLCLATTWFPSFPLKPFHGLRGSVLKIHSGDTACNNRFTPDKFRFRKEIRKNRVSDGHMITFLIV